MEPIIGIDLGTTNSEVAFASDHRVNIIRRDNDNGIVPSCVGISPDGVIVVGAEARNQAMIAPDRTVLSIKRKMGSDEKVSLDGAEFTPQEISAFILKSLRERAEAEIGGPVSKAVITTPAYFTDAQRQATREAGEIAGLDVVRIINEPTAAALAYESNNPDTRRILVYDLGGGTFDVSIVKIEDGVVEVLSSTGDNHLGGDDFDRRIVNHLADHVEKKHGVDLRDDAVAMARLTRAAETAKIELSSRPYAMVEEDHIAKRKERDLHLSCELSRMDFEEMIDGDLARTMESVNKALDDAALPASDIDKIILVGGSTRIPKVSDMLEEKFGRRPHGEIDPDLCVAMGAGIQAAREMGMEKSGVLVDITPYTFGTSAVGEIDGIPSMTKFIPLIRRNAKLPARKSDVFCTMVDEQEAVDVRVCQGEAPDAEDNVLLGNYTFHLTPAPAGAEIVMDFDLDLNGILKIRAREKATGKSIDATIENAMSRFSNEQLAETQNRIDGLWSTGRETDENAPPPKASASGLPREYREIIQRAENVLPLASREDREEIINLVEDIRDTVQEKNFAHAEELKEQLDDLLFYLEG